MAGWIPVRVIATGELLEAPAVSAFYDFDNVPADVHVWCASPDNPDQPVVVLRSEIERVLDGGTNG
jgi:hypothetical protein